MMEFLEWLAVGNRWLPVLIGLGIVCGTIVKVVELIVNRNK